MVVHEVTNLVEVTPNPMKREYLKDHGGWGFSEDMSYNPAVDNMNSSVCTLRNTTNCVGLINRGNTCYMNSVIQQLFAIPYFRREILNVRAPVPIPPPEPEAPEQAEVSAMPVASTLGPVSEMWVCSMCTFQNEMFVDSCDMCMSAKTGECEIITLGGPATEVVTTAVPDPPKQKNHDKGEVLRELQRMFYNLLWGKAGCYEPYSFVEACSVLPLQFAVTSQNDFAEFYDHVLDVLTDEMKGTPQDPAIGKALSGGVVKQRYCHKCHSLTTSSRDPFIRLELGCLKNMIPTNSLTECLDERFSSEEMTGDNKVYCEKCQKNTDTTFMDTIDALPQNLVIHLKRFSFDLETFQVPRPPCQPLSLDWMLLSVVVPAAQETDAPHRV